MEQNKNLHDKIALLTEHSRRKTIQPSSLFE
jgi:hypothetical protein